VWFRSTVFGPMKARRDYILGCDSAMTLSRLHEVKSGLALGIGLLKADQVESEVDRSRSETLGLLNHVLADLKQLEGELNPRHGLMQRFDLAASLKQQAAVLGIELELQLHGSVEGIAASHTDLLRLAGREVLLNLRRHSGTRTCRIAIDLAGCPFEFRARDWGTGLSTDGSPGHGLSLIRELAAWLGCELDIASQPGLGTEVVILGPTWAHAAKPIAGQIANAGVSSS
jgi:signal transduction histidine kinase